MASLTRAVLKRAHEAAVAHSRAQALLTDAMRDRYGCTHSDVDCDHLIDALDYGQGNCPVLCSKRTKVVSTGRRP